MTFAELAKKHYHIFRCYRHAGFSVEHAFGLTKVVVNASELTEPTLWEDLSEKDPSDLYRDFDDLDGICDDCGNATDINGLCNNCDI